MAVKIYHANFLSQSYRSSRGGSHIRFGATDDAAAAVVAAELQNWTVGQYASLYGNIGGSGTVGPYPVGTRITCNALVQDATFGVYRVRFRNVGSTITPAAVIAMLTGAAYAGEVTLAALGSAPIIPPTGNPVVSAIAPLITKY